MEYGRRFHEARALVGAGDLAEALEKGPRHKEGDVDSVLFIRIQQGALDLLADVPSDPIRSISTAEVTTAQDQGVREAVEPGL